MRTPSQEESSAGVIPQPKHPKPVSLPLLRIKPKEISNQRRRLAVYGYKYFSKIAATGEKAPAVLKALKKLQTIKFVKQFEFDPYLCEVSGISGLSQVLYKLKRSITDLNLVIRRIEKPQETNKIATCLYKISFLKKLRLELVNTKGVTDEDLKVMAKALTECYDLRVLGLYLVYIPNIAQNGVAEFIERFSRIRNLEEIKFCPSICYSPQNEFKDRFIDMPKLNNMKNFMTKSASQNGWTSMTGDAGQFLPRYISSFPDAFNPIKFKYILHKLPVSTPAVMALSQIFPKMTNTREVFIEFYSCKISELELMILAEGFREATQIEKLTFKYIEYSSIESECLMEFVGFISQLEFLREFDIFFRKLKYSDYEARTLLKNLETIPNITTVLTKESLHVHRNKNELIAEE